MRSYDDYPSVFQIRAEEIAKELAELEHHAEKLSFFENRLKWEKQAAQNAEIIEHATSSKEAAVEKWDRLYL